MKWLVPAVAVLMLSACMTPTPDPEVRKQDIAWKIERRQEAIREAVACGREHVAEADDGISDARTVSLALSMRCNEEYERVIAIQATLMDNQVQARMVRERLRSPEEREQRFLPTVLRYRSAQKNKK